MLRMIRVSAATLARPAGLLEHSRKWISRNPAVAALLSLLALLALGSFAAVTGYAVVAEHPSTDAELADLQLRIEHLQPNLKVSAAADFVLSKIGG